MKVTFTKSFFDSLKVIRRHNTWWYKTYDFIVDRLPEFLKNVYRFRKELWNHRWWDYRFTLDMFRRSLEIQEDGMRTRGFEERVSLEKKLEKMNRVIHIIKTIETEDWINQAEIQLNKKMMWSFDMFSDTDYEITEEQRLNNKEIIVLSRKLQEDQWDELWSIIHGSEKVPSDTYEYDGTDLRSWWD